MLDPESFSNSSFKKVIWGYEPAAVNSRLRVMSNEYSKLYEEYEFLTEKFNLLKESVEKSNLKIYELKKELAEFKPEEQEKDITDTERDYATTKAKIIKSQLEEGKDSSDFKKASTSDVNATTEYNSVEFDAKDDDISPFTSTSIKKEFISHNPISEEETTPSTNTESVSVDSSDSIGITDDGEEIYAGEVDVPVNESMLLGNGDDDELPDWLIGDDPIDLTDRKLKGNKLVEVESKKSTTNFSMPGTINVTNTDNIGDLINTQPRTNIQDMMAKEAVHTILNKTENEDEVFEGEIEDVASRRFMIGNDDDEDEGVTFL